MVRERLGTPVLGGCKNEHLLPHLKAAAQELVMTATSAPWGRGFIHAGKLYSRKRANLTNLSCSHAYENESTFGHELNLDTTCFVYM